MGISYSVDADEETTAKAIGREIEMSFKDSVEISKHIKGLGLEEGIEVLEDVVEGEHPVPLKSHNSGSGHTAGLEGWDAGGYPEKAARKIIDVLENAKANAENQGFDPSEMKIYHIAAHKVDEAQGMKPRAMGRASEWNTPIVDVEVVVEETEEETESTEDETEAESVEEEIEEEAEEVGEKVREEVEEVEEEVEKIEEEFEEIEEDGKEGGE